MAEYLCTLDWQRGDADFVGKRYSRAHTLAFDGGVVLPASSSPHVVPLPWSDAGAVDPEELFVASLSSCHMLWFLSIAAARGFCVDSYRDNASGAMAKNAAGRLAMTRVTLRPDARFSGTHLPTRADIEAMHHEAHEECFIANSVTTEVVTEPVFANQAPTELELRP
ncbi:OsmC family protein [Derxia lacustris]|uniref:OsmC family protein n=1 Tax=Derxia lacustris TaxID=764842 RepID=UPI000A1704E4|nr:OsmC family protein [Derxia lacustris]